MDSNSKIYVAGNTGLVGSAIIRMLHEKGLNNILSTPSSDWDLRRQEEVERFLESINLIMFSLLLLRLVVLWEIRIIQQSLSMIT